VIYPALRLVGLGRATLGQKGRAGPSGSGTNPDRNWRWKSLEIVWRVDAASFPALEHVHPPQLCAIEGTAEAGHVGPGNLARLYQAVRSGAAAPRDTKRDIPLY
jgi:hypothetical protein